MLKTLFISKLLVLLLHSVLFAQQGDNVLPKKIAFVDEFAFSDKTGIKKLSNAYDLLGSTDCFPTPCDQQIWEKQKKILIEPVLTEILNSLQQIEIQNEIIILQAGKLDVNSQLLAIDKNFDITKQFIAYFNNKSNQPDEILRLELSQSKIGVINTEIFFDNKRGIKRLIKSNNLDSKKNCAETSACIEIGKFIESYAASKGFSLILDSSKNIPKEISEFEITDVTEDFIFQYNKKFP